MTRWKNPSARRPDRMLRACGIFLVLLAASCGEEEPPPPPPPPPPPKQEVVLEPVADVMKRLGIDARIRMDEAERPSSGDVPRDLRRLESVLRFFDAMVKGDAGRLRPMLSPDDQQTLDLMEKEGQWSRASVGIDRVYVGCCGGPDPETIATLAMFLGRDGFTAQLWTVGDGEAAAFTAVPQPRGIEGRLVGLRTEPRYQQWNRILKEQAELAKQPDEKPEEVRQNRGTADESDASAPAGPASSPGDQPKGPGRRRQKGEPVKPGGLPPGGPAGS